MKPHADRRAAACSPARLGATAAAWLLAAATQLSRTEWFQQPARRRRGSDPRRAASAHAGKALAQEFSHADLSPEFHSNGTAMPDDAAYQALATRDFADWRLQVDGLVDTAASLSLAELRALPSRTQITRHDCVEGWSAIGKWTGVPLARRCWTRSAPHPAARYVVFHCADPMEARAATDVYYESIDLVDAFHPQTILAYDLNGKVLPIRQRRAAAPARRAPARLQAGQVHHAHRAGRPLRQHRRRQGRLLGRPRLRVVRRHLIGAFVAA